MGIRNLLPFSPAAFAAVCLAASTVHAHGTPSAPAPAAAPPASAAPQQGGGNAGGLGMLVGAMKGAPGCLGVEQGRVMGGRLALFGWFDGKKSALAFVNGPVCSVMRQMTQMTAPAGGAEPLSDVADEKTPVLVILSFTPSKEAGAPMGLGQAALEFWKPVTGGFAYAGRFAPSAFNVPGLLMDGPEKENGRSAALKPAAAKDGEGKKGAAGGGLDMSGLMPALAKSPGCTGVAAMELENGKRAIVSWFADKKATIDWYNSAMHRAMMSVMPPPTRAPLADVRDEKAPVIVVASITPAEKVDPKLGMALSQIAIEMYTPAKGGFSRGGWFAPAPAATPKPAN